MPRGILTPEVRRSRLIEKVAKQVYADLKMSPAWVDLPEEVKVSMRAHIEIGMYEAEDVAKEAQKEQDAEIVLASVERVPENTVMSLVISEIAEEILEPVDNVIGS